MILSTKTHNHPHQARTTMTLERLLGQAIAIVKEVAIGQAGIAGVAVALDEVGPSAVLFVEVDDDPLSRRLLEDQVQAFCDEHAAARWIMITEAERQMVRCTAHDAGAERSVLLRMVRDESGLICGLA
jgi:hypothetical protein